MLFNSIFILLEFRGFFFLSLSLTKHPSFRYGGFGLGFWYVCYFGHLGFFWGGCGVFFGLFFFFYFFQGFSIKLLVIMTYAWSALHSLEVSFRHSAPPLVFFTLPLQNAANSNITPFFQLHHWFKCFISFMICVCYFTISFYDMKLCLRTKLLSIVIWWLVLIYVCLKHFHYLWKEFTAL